MDEDSATIKLPGVAGRWGLTGRQITVMPWHLRYPLILVPCDVYTWIHIDVAQKNWLLIGP